MAGRMTEAAITKGEKTMLRSMYSGISGMKNFQTKLDVIGNNIANVNTYGFKKSRVVFKDMISQSSGGASAPTDTRGGVNPKQVGLGSQMSSIDTIHTEGSSQSTNRVLDLAIAGDGYFVVGTPNGQYSYTRSGNLYIDQNGNMVNSDGLFVIGSTSNQTRGTAADVIEGASKINIPTDAKSISIGADGSVTFIAGSDNTTVQPNYKAGDLVTAGKIVMAKFSNSSGLEKSGNNLFQQTTNSGNPIYDYADRSGLGTTQSGMLEMSNVDLSEEFTEMIVAQRGFQANTRIITTSDEILQELVNLKR